MHTDGTKQGQELPTATQSKKDMQPDIPGAVRVLRSMHAHEDVYKALDLKEYYNKR